MTSEIQFGTMTGAVIHGEAREQRRNSFARRSVSIFSRKGTETPEPEPTILSQAAMRAPKQTSERRRSWLKRNSDPVESSARSRGTILNAVPPARTIHMTPLEEEMATSPNNEILSAISGTPAKETKFEWPPTSPEQVNQIWDKSSIPLAQRAISRRRREADAKVGVWRNGIAHWDEGVCGQQVVPRDSSLQHNTVFTPPSPGPIDKLSVPLPERPLLSVVIPSSDLTITDLMLPKIRHPTPKRPAVAFVSTNTVPTSSKESSRTTSEPAPDAAISPLDSSSPVSFTRPVLRPATHIRAHVQRKVSSESKPSRKSSSSTVLSSDISDSDSVMSRESSATSFDSQPKDSRCKRRMLKARLSSSARHSSYSPSFKEWGLSDCQGGESFARNAPPLPTRAPPPPPPALNIDDDITRSLGLTEEASRSHKERIEPDTRQNEPRYSEGTRPTANGPLERAPTIPRRSRKREWRRNDLPQQAVQLSLRTARRRKSDTNLRRRVDQQGRALLLERTPSAAEPSQISDVARLLNIPLQSLMPPAPRIIVDHGSTVLDDIDMLAHDTESGRPVPVEIAEDVLLKILSSLDDAVDLRNAALINKGMYRLFKVNELHLIQAVTFNHSPPAWELRQWRCSRDGPGSEHTALSYLTAYRHDLGVIESLKLLIIERCKTVLRQETVRALSSPTHPDTQRFTDALWRIWCFCEIFGCKKGREDDVQGQLDWLKGGLLAHSQTLSATANVNLDFELGSVLLNSPEHFAKGNSGGLDSGQLYDVVELWHCMGTLVQDITSHEHEAQENGVFTNCNIVDTSDPLSGEELLEEWTAYLLTLGPEVVLGMTGPAHSAASTAFAYAKTCGWTHWNHPDHNGSRSTFLKEPASRLYEERVAETGLMFHNRHLEEQKEMSRKRVATLAAEIKLARQSSTFKRLPFTDMSMEHPISPLSRGNSTMSARSLNSASTDERQLTPITKRHTIPVPARYHRSPNFSVPRPRSPPRTLWSPRKISPIIEDRVETFNRLSLLDFGSDVTNGTAGRSVKSSQARGLLKMTDSRVKIKVARTKDTLVRAA